MKSSKSWSEVVQAVKDAFRRRCALCRCVEKNYGGQSELVVYRIDCNQRNHSKENLIVLCKPCCQQVKKEAQAYFNGQHIQPSFFPQLEYPIVMQELWFKGLQMEFFEGPPPIEEAQEFLSEPTPAYTAAVSHPTQLPLPLN